MVRSLFGNSNRKLRSTFWGSPFIPVGTNQTECCLPLTNFLKLTLQDINTTPKELKTERDCSHRQLFRPRCIFLFLSYSFGIKTINTFIHFRSSLEPDSRLKWAKSAKSIPVFRPKRRKNPTRWGGIYQGVPPGENKPRHVNTKR